MAGRTAKVLSIDKNSTDITPAELLRVAVERGANAEQLAQLVGLLQSWQNNQARQAYQAAMTKFKQRPPIIMKNRHVNDANRDYDHATLDHVTEAVTERLSAVGLTYRWKVSQSSEISVTCQLSHDAGHSEETTVTAKPDISGSKNAIQAIGSTVTYLQRYTLLSVIGMAAAGTDDDGQASGENSTSTVPAAKVGEWLTQIKESSDPVILQRRFLSAYQEAREANDKDAQAQYIKCKDERKKALRARH